ncbi:MAG: hypothetical protein ABSH03_15060 [Candidatus Lustribacter sp.]
MEKIVPLIGMSVKGPLGVAHLPRFWLKAVLAAAGVLADGYTAGNAGMNKVVTVGLGLDPDATLAYLGARPSYAAFERWVRDRATRLDTASVTALNAKVISHQKPPESAAEARARAGVNDASVCGAGLLNSLDDWATVHEALAARRGTPVPPIVPAVSTQSVGLLGLMHVPRFWMKATLAAAGALYPDWRSGTDSPLDMWFCEAIGLDLAAAIARVRSEFPSYVAFEAWVAEHAARVSPADIAGHNAALHARQKPEEVAARERALLGIDDPNYRPSIELNDLVDWHTIHADLTLRAPA